MTAYQTDYFLNERNVNCNSRIVSMWQRCPEESIVISPFSYRRPFNAFHLSRKAHDEVPKSHEESISWARGLLLAGVIAVLGRSGCGQPAPTPCPALLQQIYVSDGTKFKETWNWRRARELHCFFLRLIGQNGTWYFGWADPFVSRLCDRMKEFVQENMCYVSLSWCSTEKVLKLP